MTAELPAASPVAPGVTARGGTARVGDSVVVLTYAHAGSWRLHQTLSADPALACTAGTGLLAACEQAAGAWRKAEGWRDGQRPLSPLAAASVRALAAGVITAITARTGRPRWCETAIAPPRAAETFLQLFPGTRFLCLHRSCPGMIRSVLQASPWGVSGGDFAVFTAVHPVSTVAALADYWATHAGRLLAFEQAHPAACLRVRYEDMTADPARIAGELRDFLGLDGRGPLLPVPPGDEAADGWDRMEPGDPGDRAVLALEQDAEPGDGAGLPVAQIPAPLLTQVNQLNAKLSYPPLETHDLTP